MPTIRHGALFIHLDTLEETNNAMQEYENNHEKVKCLVFEWPRNNNNNENKSIMHQNFVTFLNFLATTSFQHSLRTTNKYIFRDQSIGFNEAKILSQILNNLHSPSIELLFHGHVSHDGFQYLMSEYAKKTFLSTNQSNCRKIRRIVPQQTKLAISGHGIKCSHMKCFNQELLSSLFGNLSICQSKVSDDGAITLTNALCQNRTITSLDLSYNRITSFGAQAIAKLLCENSCLKSLNLSRNRIGDEGVVTLATSLQVNSSLQTLCLFGIGCGSQGLLALAECLSQNNGLKKLYLSSNEFTDNDMEGLIALGSSLKQNSTLNHLDLRDIFPVGDNGQKIGAFVNSLDGKTSKLRLFLGHYMRLDFNNDAFSLLVQCNAPLLSLSLICSDLKPRHFEAVAQGIQQQTFNVETLKLDWATADDDSVTHLIDALVERKSSCAFKELSLSSLKGITSVGLQYIVDKIRLTNLERLNLSEIPIDNAKVQQIASFLNETKLTALNLRKVGMEDSDLIALSDALKSNSKLTYLNLIDNQGITVSGKQVLLDTLKDYNMTMNNIYLGGCGDSTLVSEIEFYLELNRAQRQKFCDSDLVSVKLFPFILFGCDHDIPSIMYWILQSCPHIYTGNDNI